MKKRNIGVFFLAICITLCLTGFAHADTWYKPNSFIYSYDDWSITNLGFLPGGWETFSQRGAINNKGQVVGSSAGNNFRKAFIWTDGVMTDLGTFPGSNSSIAYGINDIGQVVGNADNKAFFYSDGAVTILDGLPGSTNCRAVDINNNGQIIGTAKQSSGFSIGYLYHDGVYTQLEVPGSPFFTPYSINSSGQVVGEAMINSGPHIAVLYSNGEVISLVQPGWTGSRAYSINDSGQVVGIYWDSANVTKSFLYSDGEIIDLGSLFGDDTFAYDINNHGQIVGWSLDNNDYYPFLWSDGVMVNLGIHPEGKYTRAMGINDHGQILINAELSAPIPNIVPLPSTVLLLGTGLIGLAGLRKKLKK
jgi:probable HAF family extracellular repeat protein